MKKAFTLVELLVVIAIIGVLAALLLSSVARTHSSARRMVCVSNLRQINLALQMYAGEHSDSIQARTNHEELYITYKESLQPYLTRGGSGVVAQVFTCPADDFDCDDPRINDLFSFWPLAPSGKSFCCQPVTDYSSYFFNGDAPDSPNTRMAGKAFSSIREASRVVLIGELSAGFGLSAHDRRHPYQFNNARNVLSFVDGHVAYVAVYWNGVEGFDGIAASYEPPAGYEYRWLSE
jgi:prepilin-type N-terminal cleavage/methylation domain-containing protein